MSHKEELDKALEQIKAHSLKHVELSKTKEAAIQEAKKIGLEMKVASGATQPLVARAQELRTLIEREAELAKSTPATELA